MKFEVHHYHHHEMPPHWAVEIKGQLEKIMAAIDDLQADVTAEDTVIDSAITLLKGLSDALTAAGTDPAKLAQLRADVQAKTQALAEAVAANTPAAPAPPAPPTT